MENVIKIEDVKKGVKLTDDEWFDKMGEINKLFYCPNCDEKFRMYDVEKNEKKDKIWCLECDKLLFSI